MIHLHRLLRYDTYCTHPENLINCEEENSLYLGPIMEKSDSKDKS